MSIGVLFWLVMILCFIFGFYTNRTNISGGDYNGFGGSLIVFFLLFLLGWKVFGFVVQG